MINFNDATALLLIFRHDFFIFLFLLNVTIHFLKIFYYFSLSTDSTNIPNYIKVFLLVLSNSFDEILKPFTIISFKISKVNCLWFWAFKKSSRNFYIGFKVLFHSLGFACCEVWAKNFDNTDGFMSLTFLVLFLSPNNLFTLLKLLLNIE